MTVKELIERLEEIDDKNKDILIDSYGNPLQIDDITYNNYRKLYIITFNKDYF